MKLFALGAALGVCLVSGCSTHEVSAPSDHHAVAYYPYHKPLTSIGAKFGMMSQAARDTTLAEAGSAEIADVVKDSTPDLVYYKVTFEDAVNRPPLYVAPDGSLLNPDLTVAIPAPQATPAGTLSDLPPSLAKLIAEREPTVEVASTSKEVWGGRVVYVISFKDEGRYHKLYAIKVGENYNLWPK